MKKLYSDKKFGKLFKPGDKLLVKNLWANTSVEREVECFDGLEYKMKGLDEYHNIGHNGYVLEDGKVYILMNGSKLLELTIEGKNE